MKLDENHLKSMNTDENQRKPMKINELDELANWWGKPEDNYKSRKENSQSWKVSIEKIKSHNYNLDYKNPHIVKQEIHDPELLISEYAEIKKKTDSLRNKIKNILFDSFKIID